MMGICQVQQRFYGGIDLLVGRIRDGGIVGVFWGVSQIFS
jgi:hypothetical protein